MSAPSITPFARALVALALLVAALPARAVDYAVEIVLFEHRRGPVVGDDRYWYPVPVRALSLGGAEAAEAGFEPVEALTLATEAERLRANGYRVLRHFAWRQPGLDEANAIPVRVNLGQRIALFTAEGDEARGRFLPASPAPLPERSREVASTTVAGTLRVRLGRFLHLEAALAYNDPDTGTGYRLDESRKMRSRELHYLDNPRFGLLTRIVPVDEEDPEAGLAPAGADPGASDPAAPPAGADGGGLPDAGGAGDAPVQ